MLFSSSSAFAENCLFDNNNMVVELSQNGKTANRFITGRFVSHYPPRNEYRGAYVTKTTKLNVVKQWIDGRYPKHDYSDVTLNFSYGYESMKLYKICKR